MINKNRKIDIQRTITELEHPYPKNDLIKSYSDFLKVRNFLGSYQFNPVFFENLARLVNEIWNTEKRISRLSLLQKMKQYLHQTETREYYSRNTKQNIKLNIETSKLLFQLFRKTFEECKYISDKQLEEARIICNSVLINLELNSTEQEWLCENAHVSELILNRVLRYPVKSLVISSWAKGNYHNDILRSRRAEHLSWIIDSDPAFEIEYQTLVDDFEYLNQSDLQAIQNYDHEIIGNKLIKKELAEYLPKRKKTSSWESAYQEEIIDLSVTEIKLSKRPYSVPIDPSKEYPLPIPNFEDLREDFYTNLPIHQKITMIWAIGYSRIDNELKFSLLKKYYSNETYYSMFKVCKKTKNIELLKWVLTQQ